MDLVTTMLYIFCVFIALLVIYDQLTKRIPSRLQEAEKPKSGVGLIRADELSEDKARAHGIDFIFVHGLGSNPDTTWGPKGSNWVSDFLPDKIPKEFHKEIRIFFYNYDSYWKRDAIQTRLSRLGRSLVDGLCSKFRQTEDEQTRSLVFVGHSYGGLVIKQALALASQDQSLVHITKHTIGVVFLGTPHRGSSFGAWGSLAARALQPLGSNLRLLQEVKYDALPLLDLHEGFEMAKSKECKIFNFFEERKTRLLTVWFFRWEEFCVREQSATYHGVPKIPLPVDHSGLNKFESSENPNFKAILERLLSIITPIASQKQHRFFSVPSHIVGTYTERQELSAAITKGLRVRHEKASVPNAIAIHGLGGTGKTQLALKYIEDHKNEYNPILWIDAKDEESVRNSYVSCAHELQLPISTEERHSTSLVDSPTVQAVRRWLENRKVTDDAWLVVVDNADQCSHNIENVLPRGDRGSIIITSQDSWSFRLIDGGCEVLHVDIMTRVEARTLLLQHIGLDHDSATSDVNDDCDEIAAQLGHLALAVDIAGAYISTSADMRKGLQQYLQDYIRHKDDLLQDKEFQNQSPNRKTVWTVWDTTLQALDRLEDPSADLPARLLLPFLARFEGATVQDELFKLAGHKISRTCEKLYNGAVELPNWLMKVITIEGGKWDDYNYRRTRDRLVRFGLLQRTGGEWPGVSMHGLVQWRATKYEAEQPWEKWYLITILAACIQLSKDTARPHFRRELVAQLPSMGKKYLNDQGIEDKNKHFALRAVSTVYFYEGQSKRAEELEVQVMETSLRVFGKEHPKTLDSMANLVATYINQGRWKEAEELGVQVIETRKRVLGEKHPDTLDSMGSLALTIRKQGRWREAEELGVQVMEARKRVLGEKHPDTLNSIGNLAIMFKEQGRWKEAEELEVQVLEMNKRVLGEEHPSTLNSMANLACTLKLQSRNQEALSLLETCFQLRKKVLDEHHPDTKAVHVALRRWRAENNSKVDL